MEVCTTIGRCLLLDQEEKQVNETLINGRHGPTGDRQEAYIIECKQENSFYLNTDMGAVNTQVHTYTHGNCVLAKIYSPFSGAP